ncbi:hypothetical protein QOZ80_5AG0380440 [Eleusine coracana subsp. coracana]|nr:hypothetical protein QOZ80_5AG0380440 [Eleusine coracana subsp. coracana]
METSGASAGEVGWYVLGPNQESVGPYALVELQAHFANGYLNEGTMLWAEGRSDWMPLYSIPELNSVVTAKGPPQQAGPVVEDDLEKFQKEIVEAEAEVDALKGSADDGDVNQELDERPATPPDGEEEFTDDDGTIYKWDRTLRAWVPQNDAPDK